MRHLVIAFTLASALSSPGAFAQAQDDVVARFAGRTTAAPTVDGVAVAGPVVLVPRPPEDIPPSLHEQIRHLKARLDNAYPDASDARKLAFIADYLDISFRRLWNAYHPDRPEPPVVRPADVRRVDARPVDVRPVDVRPVDVRRDRVRPDRVRPDTRPAPVARPGRVRG
jgi:hypothetical protein